MAPENRLAECDDWFKRRPSPLAMTGFLCQYLQSHFEDPKSIEQINLFGPPGDTLTAAGPLHTGGPETPIVIQSVTSWRPDLTDKRPAVVVARQDWTVERIGIADRLFGGEVEQDGSIYYCKLYKGAHTLFCVHRNGATVEMLAAEVVNELDQFAQNVREELGLMTFGVAGCGKLFKLEEPKEHYAVPVTVAYVCQRTWRTIPAAPKLKTVRFTNTKP